MNCFEARQDFPAFWRRELLEYRRAELAAHLGECLKCDAAFRTFAMTAPVLHSIQAPDTSAAQPREFTLKSPMHAAASNPRASYREPRRWLAMCASVIIFIVAATGAYMAATPPAGSLSEALTNPQEPSVQELFGPDAPDLSNDLAG
jgi:predicted anti-sigma-YlaC factor YlaD